MEPLADELDLSDLEGYHGYQGKLEWEDMADRGTDLTEESTRVQSTLRALYDSNTPFFRQADIRELNHQLESAEIGDHVHIRGLDGNVVDIEVETGRVFSGYWPDMERVLTAPFIEYIPFEDLVAHDDMRRYLPRLAYCNLRVHYWMNMRMKTNKQLVLPPLRPLDVVQTYFDDVQQKWNADEACIQFMSTVQSTLPHCTNIVSFGLGEISRVFRKECQPRSAFQHALLSTLHKALISHHADRKVMCYAQDPAYSAIDKSLLSKYGISAVDDPHGTLQVTDSSAVLSCAPNAPIKEIIADIARPALLIWYKARDFPDLPAGVRSIDPESPRVLNMIRNHYHSIDFPGDATYFEDLVIHIRRR